MRSGAPAVKVIAGVSLIVVPVALIVTVTASATWLETVNSYVPAVAVSLTVLAVADPLGLTSKFDELRPLIGLSLTSRSATVTVDVVPTTRFAGLADAVELDALTSLVDTVDEYGLPEISTEFNVIVISSVPISCGV